MKRLAASHFPRTFIHLHYSSRIPPIACLSHFRTIFGFFYLAFTRDFLNTHMTRSTLARAAFASKPGFP